MLPLVVSGFMATGKSTVGRAVAEKLGRPFIDLDERVEARAGCSVSELFQRQGEPAFRSFERDALVEALQQESAIIAVGGGALLSRELRLQLLETTRVVTLTADAEELCRRVAVDESRPLLGVAPDLDRIRELTALRAPVYAECHVTVATDGRSLDAVVSDVCSAVEGRLVAVACGESSYAVELGAGVAPERLRGSTRDGRVHCLVTDRNVDPLYGDDVLACVGGQSSAFRLVVDPGEQSKTVDAIRGLWTQAAEFGLDRSTRVVGLGGGVVTDIAGFFAATWLRGLQWAAVPTTLLAMVDASVGGKTGVDFLDMKNAVGAFWQPQFVVCDTRFLATEPMRGFRSALAEVVKTALVGDEQLLSILESQSSAVLERQPEVLAEVVHRCVTVKARIVSRDVREAGLRAVLNLGHTLGHALEAQTGFQRFTHGEAVSIGLIAALRAGQSLGHTPPAVTKRVHGLLAKLGLPVEVDQSLLEASLSLLHRDKKRYGPNIRFVVAHDVGDVRTLDIAVEKLRAALLTVGA